MRAYPEGGDGATKGLGMGWGWVGVRPENEAEPSGSLRDLLHIPTQPLRSEVAWATDLISWVSFLIFKVITWGMDSPWEAAGWVHTALPLPVLCAGSLLGPVEAPELINGLGVIWREARRDESSISVEGRRSWQKEVG